VANRYRGDVEFEIPISDSEQKTYVLRLGVNQYLAAQKELETLDGRAFQRRLLHLALVHGAESQKDLTLEDAGDLLDDLGFVRANELINQTKFGRNIEVAQAAEKAARDVAAAAALKSLTAKLAAVRKDIADPEILHVIDGLLAKLDREAAAHAAEGAGNPPGAATRSSS